MSKPKIPGMFSLVLHTHLPWLNNHGRWPVGEEWLYQAWSESYIPVFDELFKLKTLGFEKVLTLGVTPILNAMLDDKYSLIGMEHWLGNALLRSQEAIQTNSSNNSSISAESIRNYGKYEYVNTQQRINLFNKYWKHGASQIIRNITESNVIELLSGPLTHSFQPLMPEILRDYALKEGLNDTQIRTGSKTKGIWAPECAYKPGMEDLYEECEIKYFIVDGPSFNNDTHQGHKVGKSNVVAFGRDLNITYKVWSPTTGYPGHPYYRDFYLIDKPTGLKIARVTGKNLPKQPYNPELAEHALDIHVNEFVNLVKNRLLSEYERTGKPPLVMCAFDTELFGHWWHEGPRWLSKIFPALEEAGITFGTLNDAYENNYYGDSYNLKSCSWGTGKDFHVWNGPQVKDIVELNNEVNFQALKTIKSRESKNVRDEISDHILRELLLMNASDWAFLITKDTASNYAKNRVHKHAHAVREICYSIEIGDEKRALELVNNWRKADNVFPQIDSRRLEFK